MVNFTKTQILHELSEIEDVVFVGGASEFIQGFKNQLNDIDISINNIEPLKRFGYIFKGFENSFYGLSGNRAFIPLNNVLIDVFVDIQKPEFIIIGNYKCQTLDSMIALRENSLNFKTFNGSNKNKNKIIENLERLKKIPR